MSLRPLFEMLHVYRVVFVTFGLREHRDQNMSQMQPAALLVSRQHLPFMQPSEVTWMLGCLICPLPNKLEVQLEATER